MERLRDMALGFMVYLLILGGLYSISDKPQSHEQLHGGQKGMEVGEVPTTLEGRTLSFSLEGSTALNASVEQEKLKGPVPEIRRNPGSSYTQTGRTLENPYNFLEIIPFMDK